MFNQEHRQTINCQLELQQLELHQSLNDIHQFSIFKLEITYYMTQDLVTTDNFYDTELDRYIITYNIPFHLYFLSLFNTFIINFIY